MAVYGVAVAVPDPWAEELQTWRERVGDPLARAIPPHVTLLPPTEIEDDALPRYTDHLRAVGAGHAAFPMHLRGSGTFRPVSPVVFVQVAQGIPGCEQLERAVRSGPVERALEFPYHPHVTVAHHIDEAALDRAFDGLGAFEARFEVTQFSLYAHGADEVWRPIQDFTLRG